MTDSGLRKSLAVPLKGTVTLSVTVTVAVTVILTVRKG